MILTQFDYVAPRSIGEAVQQLQQALQGNVGAAVLAGGHSLLPAMKTGRVAPSLLIDLRQIAELSAIASPAPGGGLRIGALATYAAIAAVPAVAARYAALHDALAALGDPQVRNRGTIGGSLAYNDPAADLPAVALALEATVVSVGPHGPRTRPAAELLSGPRQTSLQPGEIVTAVELPPAGVGSGSAYEKFKNPGSGYAICGVAAAVQLAPDGTLAGCRVALTGAAAAAARLRKVEAALVGKDPTAANIAAAAGLAAEEGLTFVGDLAASAAYRAHLAVVLAARALTRAVERARQQ